jgi:hypothetical protein
MSFTMLLDLLQPEGTIEEQADASDKVLNCFMLARQQYFLL